jgi:hypothetical protein
VSVDVINIFHGIQTWHKHYNNKQQDSNKSHDIILSTVHAYQSSCPQQELECFPTHSTKKTSMNLRLINFGIFTETNEWRQKFPISWNNAPIILYLRKKQRLPYQIYICECVHTHSQHPDKTVRQAKCMQIQYQSVSFHGTCLTGSCTQHIL